MVETIDSQAVEAVAHSLFSGKPRGPSVGFFTLLVIGWSMESPGFWETLPRLAMTYVVVLLFLQVNVVINI